MNAGLDELYREVILDHHRRPRGQAPLAGPADLRAEGKNPSCGDELVLELACAQGAIAGAHVECHGCAIATASGSILADLLVGRTPEQARALAEAFREAMHTADGALPDELEPGDLEVLTGVRKFPARVKCALLPWITLLSALEAPAGGAAAPATTEG
jgi:nitrogen fixation protein NifU and related proteins